MKNVDNFHYLTGATGMSPCKNRKGMFHKRVDKLFSVTAGILFFVAFIFNPSLSSQTTSPGLIDLTIKSVEVLTPQVFAGEWVKLRVTVENRGSANAPDFNVDLFKNPRNSQALPVAGDLRHIVRGLQKKSEIQIDYVFQAKSRNYALYFKVDAAESIKEISESNNIYGVVNIQVQQGERPDDEFEENDSLQSAPMLTNGLFNLVSADDDYFSIQASTGQYIDVSAVFDASAANLDLVLLDSTGKQLIKSATYFEKERVLYLVPESNKTNQTFIIHILPGGGRTEYSLDVRIGRLPDLTVSMEGVPEFDHSIIPTEAQLQEVYDVYLEEDGITLNDEQKAIIKRNMTKYFYNVKISITNKGKPLERSFYLDLFRTSRLAPTSGSYGENWSIIHPGDFQDPSDPAKYLSTIHKTIPIEVIPGEYTLYVTVDNDASIQEMDETNNVSLPVELVAGDNIVVDDNFEANNVFPGAPITPGVYTNLKALDDDYFNIVIPPEKVLNVSIDFLNSLGDLDLYLYDDKDTLLVRSVGTSNREFISYLNSSGVPKTVIIRVDEISQNLKYSLGINITPFYEVDLVVNQIAYSPLSVSQGDSVTATVQLENRGANDAFNVRVDLFDLFENTALTKGSVSDNHNVVIPVVHGHQKTSVNFVFPVGQGSHYLTAIVDTTDTLGETNEENNIFGPVSILVGDGLSDDALEVSNGKENDAAPDSGTIVPQKYNQLVAIDEDWYSIELAPGKTLQTALYFTHMSGDIDGFYYRYDSDISDYVLLKSSATATNNEILSYRNDSAEPMTIFIRILPLEQANTYSMDVQSLSGGGYPDLLIASMVSFPVHPVAGETVRTTIAIENRGTAPTADTSYIDFYHSFGKPDYGLYGDLFEVIPSGLAPGEKIYINFEYKMEAGDYHLYAISDTDNTIVESLESNNVFGPNLIQVSPETNKNMSAENMQVTMSGPNMNVLLNIADTSLAAGEVFHIKFDLVDSTNNVSAKSIYEWEDIVYTHTLNTTGTASLSYNLKTDAHVPSGNYYLRVKLDSNNAVLEANEADNIKMSNSISITNPGTPYWIETVEATGKSEADTVMEVYRYSGSALNRDPSTLNSLDLELIRKSDNMIGHRSGTYMNLETGSYFIRIYGKGESTGAYQIGVRGGYATQILPSATNGSLDETLNSFTQAKALEPGEGRIEYISSTTDEDWFFVTVYSIDTYQVAAATNDTVKVELYRFDNSSGWSGVSSVTLDQLQLIASQSKYGSFGSVQSILGVGKYFIRVYSDPGFRPSYGIIFSETSNQRPYVYGQDGVMDSYENDSGAGFAKSLLPEMPQFHTLFLQIEDPSQPPVDGVLPLLETDDEDWYFYEVQK